MFGVILAEYIGTFVLSLIAAGHAIPTLALSNADIAHLLGVEGDENLLVGSGIISRPTVLDHEYLFNTHNINIYEGWKKVTASPSELGAAAVNDLLVKAGVSISEISLLLADTLTPFETCPAEAPRIGSLVGFKGPAYDLIGGSGAFALFCETLKKQHNFPADSLVVCVSTNTPTPFIQYNSGSAPVFFADGAAALLFRINATNSQLENSLEVCDAHFWKTSNGPFIAGIRASSDIYHPIKCSVSRLDYRTACPTGLLSFIRSWKEYESPRRLLLAEPSLVDNWNIDVDTDEDIDTINSRLSKEAISEVVNYGRSFGTQPILNLSIHWNKALSTELVAVLCGDGTDGNFGYVLLKNSVLAKSRGER